MSSKKRVGIWKCPAYDTKRELALQEDFELTARKFAVDKGWEVVSVYDLGDVPVLQVTEYHQYKRMVVDIKDKQIDCLMVLQTTQTRYPDVVYQMGIILKNFKLDLFSLNTNTMMVSSVSIPDNPLYREMFEKEPIHFSFGFRGGMNFK